MSKKVAEVIVETLQSAGVKTCYGIVGDTLNTLATSLSRSDIKFVHMRHEEAGAFAAQGEALLMDRLTAVAGSCGPGSLHFINGLYEANRNRAPLIPDRNPGGAPGHRLQFNPGGRFRSSVQGLQRFLRDDPDAGAGPAQGSRGLSGGADEAWRRGTGRAGGYLQCSRARGTAVCRPCPAANHSPE